MQQSDLAGAVLRIDLNAVVANYRLIKAMVAPAFVAAVVKADAYGLGAIQVSKALQEAGCHDFFVAHVNEADALKSVLDAQSRIFILNGLPSGAEAFCAELGAIPVLNSLDQLDRWNAQASQSGAKLPAAIQIDTGMSRLGLPPEELTAILHGQHLLGALDVQLLMSHLACADEPGSAVNSQQVAAFQAASRHFPGAALSLDNSGGSFADRPHFNLVRAGIALYGGAPHSRPSPMQSVVSLHARIIQIRSVQAGSLVGYGAAHICEGASRIATISVGYADGWPRHLSGRGAAYIAGVRVPIVGRVSMDSITLDVTDIPEASLGPGCEVELLGTNQRIDDVAADADTISYEILTQLGHRYHREYAPVGTCLETRSF